MMNHHRSDTMHSGKKTTFRLFCRVNTAGGVIGPDGRIIEHLRKETHTKISIDKNLAKSDERVIKITGNTSITNNITITKGYSRNDVEIVAVSNIQKALLMVFERMVEVEGEGEGEGEIERCRMLVGVGQMGSVIGKEGRVIKTIENQTRASIMCFKEFVHPCALPGDELIQITGNVFAVKKAMLAVSSRLQPFPPWGYESPEILGNCNMKAPLSRGVAFEDATNDHPGQLELDRDIILDGKSVQIQVSFRLLCPYDAAGGVIGRKADIVKAMEKETGASIRFSAPLDTSHERVATIKSFEKPGPLCSPAQDAVLHVFTRSVEIKGMDERRSVEARILVGPEEINCLIDNAGKISADISLASGVEIQLLGADFAPSCAKDDDIVVQLTGNFAQVKETLYQITGRLRESFFSRKVSDEEGFCQHSKSSNKSNNSIKTGSASSVVGESIRSFPRAHDAPDFNQKVAVHSPRLPHEMFKAWRDKGKVENQSDHITSEVKQSYGSNDTEATKIVTVEIVVPEQAFGNVYGENGNNLARLKEISGATVIVQEPGPGNSGGMVVISGTMERVHIAQSLLQAYILL